MSTSSNPPAAGLPHVTQHVPPTLDHGDGYDVKRGLEDEADRRVDAIEMIGEEEAAGFRPAGVSEVSPGMRYLHCSRTINQLVGDRNRAVGLYLAVATLLWTASTAMLNASSNVDLIIPIDSLKRWCLPFTFGSMTVLAGFAGLLLVRTRVGLIYEVAKMNELLGLPAGRVMRINPLGLFFIQHTMISMAGSVSAALFSAHMLRLAGLSLGAVAIPSALIAVACFALMIWMYIYAVRATTTDEKLIKAAKGLATAGK